MKFIQDNFSAIIFTLIVHVIVIGLFALNIDFSSDEQPELKKVAVQAQVVNGEALDAEVKRQAKLEQDKLDAEIQRQKDIEDKALEAQKKVAAEEQRLAELEKKRMEKELAAKRQAEIDKKKKAEDDKKRRAEEIANQKKLAEQKKKADAEELRLADLAKKRKIEEARIKKLADEKKKAEAQAAEKKKLEAEKKALAAAERKKEAAARQAEIEAEEKRLAQEQERLDAAMAEEAEFEELIGSGAQARYYNAIQQAITRQWSAPSSTPDGMECTLDVSLIPGGEVTALTFGKCDVDAAVKLSIEQAVFKASPFPEPEDARLFERREVLLFKPNR